MIEYFKWIIKPQKPPAEECLVIGYDSHNDYTFYIWKRYENKDGETVWELKNQYGEDVGNWKELYTISCEKTHPVYR